MFHLPSGAAMFRVVCVAFVGYWLGSRCVYERSLHEHRLQRRCFSGTFGLDGFVDSDAG